LAGIYVCPDFSLRYITKDDTVKELSLAV